MTMPNDTTPQVDDLNQAGGPDEGSMSDNARAQIRDVKDQVVDRAKDSFRQARQSAGSSLNQSRQQAADRIDGLANAVRGTSERLRSDQQDRIADLTDSLASQVERLGDYLRTRDPGDVRRDVEAFARRQPAVVVGVALAIGMLGARFLKSGQGRDETYGRGNRPYDRADQLYGRGQPYVRGDDPYAQGDDPYARGGAYGGA
jgi:hypothetical protein